MGTHEHKKNSITSARIGILSISTTRTIEDDKSGLWIKKRAEKEGHSVVLHEVVDDDRNLIEETRLNISQLVSRGIDLQQCVQPLCDQEDVCNNRVDNQLHQLRYELETLKRKDDRIKSNINIDNLIHSLEDKSFEESFKIVIDIYDSLYLNLLEDIDVLNRAKQDILGYINLGLGLQDAVNTIDNEINDIRNVLRSSKERLDGHIRVAKDESNIIV